MNFDVKAFILLISSGQIRSMDMFLVTLMYTNANASLLVKVKDAFSIIENLKAVFENIKY